MTRDIGAITADLLPHAAELAERLLGHDAERRAAELARFFVRTPSTAFADPVHLIVLFSTLAHALTQRFAGAPRPRPAPATNDDTAWVERIERTICEHYADPLTLSVLARMVDRDRRQVAAEFRDRAGVTVHQFLTHVRMTHAVLHIVEGDKIEFVGLAVGYRSKKNFYRQFRAVTGLTPAAFRRLACTGTDPRAINGDADASAVAHQRGTAAPGCETDSSTSNGDRTLATGGDPR